MEKKKSIHTHCVHSGSMVDSIAGGINTPIFTSTSYKYLDSDELLYPRYANTPNNRALIDKICALEGGEAALFFSSGMAAICTTILGLLGTGDHIVFQPNLYGGTLHFIQRELNRFGIEYSICDSVKIEAFLKAVKTNTKAVFIETPSNPLLTITDIEAVTRMAAEKGLISIMDNTFASPVNQNPLQLGIDVVLHSATKYLGGHSDICAGAAVSSKELMKKISGMAASLGGSLDASTCYLLERSMKTLAVRVEQQNRNAMEISQFLKGHSGVGRVYYPGLKDHPGHETARKQMAGFGGMLSFEVLGMDAGQFQKKLKLIRPSMSLGGVESIVCSPVATSHRNLSPQERDALGITDSLVRLSVGIENVEDLMADLQQALT